MPDLLTRNIGAKYPKRMLRDFKRRFGGTFRRICGGDDKCDKVERGCRNISGGCSTLWDKTRSFCYIKNSLSHERGSEVSERANK